MESAEEVPEGAEEEAPDPRARWLLRCAARGLRGPAERWERGLCRAELRAFLAGAAGPALLAWPGPGGQLLLGPPPAPPAAGRPKALFFLRRPGPGALLCGDLPADALQHLAALLHEVRAAPRLPAGPGAALAGPRGVRSSAEPPGPGPRPRWPRGVAVTGPPCGRGAGGTLGSEPRSGQRGQQQRVSGDLWWWRPCCLPGCPCSLAPVVQKCFQAFRRSLLWSSACRRAHVFPMGSSGGVSAPCSHQESLSYVTLPGPNS